MFSCWENKSEMSMYANFKKKIDLKDSVIEPAFYYDTYKSGIAITR